MTPGESKSKRDRRESRKKMYKLVAALKKAIADYGKPGGPWNVPDEPGTWIAMAREAVGDDEETK